MGVANRDIKLENVLLTDKKSPPTNKLTDFHFCKSDRDSIPTTLCGTHGYMGARTLKIRTAVVQHAEPQVSSSCVELKALGSRRQ